MENIYSTDDNGLVNRTFSFKYVETTWIDGREISNTEKTWEAGNLEDFYKFKGIWEQLEAFDEHYQLTEVGSLIEDGNVSMVLDYTLETDYQETIKYIRGISYEVAE